MELLVHTFGSTEPKSTFCGVTKLDIWDLQGEKHEFQLCATPMIINNGKSAQLSDEDLAYIRTHRICLSSKSHTLATRPQILLGCDQLWSLLEVPSPRHTLPSGMQLIPSKLGYLVTGKQKECFALSKNHHSTSVATINASLNFAEELECWDKYWSLDSAGIHEFNGTKDAEKAVINEQVSKFFEATIEKRKRSYYVRFPYKDNHPPLPTNKNIALKRLRSVIEMLQGKPDLLREYEKTFNDQLTKGIIEEIPNDKSAEGVILHYIPHQPVVTPAKETTKLRIVFDASAHFRGSPSLNDIIHQGPLILPELYAMLLRFRVSRYVATSDVEKAFLQVFLHEADRDATRFLWVRNTNLPIDDSNLVTYRFTRVTFGLNVSPFLLAGTIHHHLRYE
ncbi:hypothetical protein ANCDUO_21457, partial [Ancylostoma duodenale]